MTTILTLENEHIRVILNEDGSAGLFDKSHQTSWRMGPVAYQEDNPVDIGHIWLRNERSQCEQYPGRFRVAVEGDHLRVTVIGPLAGVAGSFACRYQLDGRDLLFTLLEVDESLPSLVYPPAFAAASLVMPTGVGTWFRRPVNSRRIVRFYSGLNMRWFGGLAQGDDLGWIAIFEQNHEDCGISFTQSHASPLYLRSLGRWTRASFPRVIRYQFTSGGYVGLAMAFRRFAMTHGLHRSLREKLEETPALDNLIGGRELNCFLGTTQTAARAEDRLQAVPEYLRKGPQVSGTLTCGDVIKVTAEARRLGMKRGIAMLRGWIRGGYDESHPDIWPPETVFGSPEEYRCIVSGAAGFPGGLHDNYGDIYPHVPSFPHGTLRMPDGSPKRGGYWAGGQCYLLDPREGLAYARRNWQQVRTLAPAKIYSDTITAMYLDESFAADRTLSRARDLAGKLELMRFFKSAGVILASEEGADFGGSVLDTADTSHRRHCTAESVSIPLWPLVYHDAMLCGRHNSTPADMQSPTPWHVTNLLWGYYTMWRVPNAVQWRDGFAETLFVEEFNRRTALDAMTQHRFLDADMQVEQTEFASGARVVANFSANPVDLDGTRVAAYAAEAIY